MLQLSKRRYGLDRRAVPVICVLLFSAGTVLSWYANAFAGFTSQTPLAMGFSQITTGNDFACGISRGTNLAYCWGDGQYGRLGTGSTTSVSYPTAVSTSGVLSGKTIKSIDAGYNMACVIASDDLGYCWGGNGSGELGNNTTTDSSSPVAVNTSGVLSGKTLKKITVGHIHTCAIASDDQAYCWGNNVAGQLGNNSTSNSSVPVAVNTSGVLSGKTILDISSANFGSISLAIYYSHTCAIASDNNAYCWGYNEYGQLGNNSTVNSSVPVAVNTSGVLSGKAVTAISGGYHNTCAIASSAAYCWGVGTTGALGNNASSNSSVPVAVYTSGVLSGKTLTTVASSGTNSSCVLDDAGAAYCWGNNTFGQLGDNSTTASTVPVAVYTSDWLSGKTIQSISTNGHFAVGGAITAAQTCVVTTDYKAYCWGSDSFGQLGSKFATAGSTSPVAVPVLADNDPFATSSWRLYANADSVTPGSPLAATDTTATVKTSDTLRLRTGLRSTVLLTSIKSGQGYNCGLTADGAAYCWGYNEYGQLGNNSTVNSSVPVAVDTSGVLSGKTILSLVTASSHVCALASDSQVYCWGENTYGALGNNSTTQSSVPVAVYTSGVLSGKTVLALSAFGSATCVIASDNKAYCWGYNSSGQLGNNSKTPSSVPVAVYTSGVLSGKTILSISAGGAYACAIASDNKAYCWGNNNWGQLGDNTGTETSVPVAVYTAGVLSGKTIKSISAGAFHTCAIASDNLAYCWGDNNGGSLGNNSTVGSNAAVAVNTSGALSGKTILAISAGGNNLSCAIASDHKAYCWGYNYAGEVGNNSTTDSWVPAAVYTSGVLSGKTILSISAGNSHACALATDNQVYCWGDNYYGQLGDNTTTESHVPLSFSNYSYMLASSIPASLNTYKLQYAKKTVSACSDQTGYADVTESTTVAYSTNGSVSNGASISGTANDPVATSTSTPQTYISASGTFTNTSAIAGDKIGLWDFSLKTVSAEYSANYCLRMTYGNGTAVENSTYPEIAIQAASLSVGFVDADGADLSSPTISFGGVMMKGLDSQISTGALGTSSQKLRVYNDLATNGWSVSIAATSGAAALWNRSDSLAKYDFNDSGGSVDGGDSDLLGGQLTVNPAASTITPSSGCSATGLSSGSQASFSEGGTDSITLMSASSAAALSCNYDLTSVGLSQIIPAGQLPGTYTVDMTMTVVAL